MLQYLTTRLSLPLTSEHYTPLCELHLFREDFKAALNLLDHMESQGLAPTTQLGAALAQAAERSFKVAMGIYGRSQRSDPCVKLPFAAVTIPAAIKGLVEHKQYSAASDLFTSMKGHFTPDLELYNDMISLCVATGDQAAAEDFFRTLTAKGFKGNSRTYASLVTVALKQPEYESAFYWLEEMKAAGLKPPLLVYQRLIDRLREANDPRVGLAEEDAKDNGHLITASREKVPKKH